MMNFLVLVSLASCLVAQPSAPIAGTVVDERGKAIAGALIAISPGVGRDGSVSILATTVTDLMGQFRVEDPGVARSNLYREGAIFAYKPGLGVGVVELIREDQPDRGHRVVLEPFQARKITIRDAGGNAINGARVATRVIEGDQTGYMGVTVPDDWVERLSVTTDANGLAALPGLTRRIKLRSVRVTIPGRGRHFVAIPLASAKDDTALVIRQLSGLAGAVRSHLGNPIAGADVEVWVRCGSAFGEQQASYGIPERVRFDSGPIRTDSLGSFKTPPLLLTGSTYRVVVRATGHSPVLSDWITLKTESNSLAPIIARPVRTILGRVVDRQGNPIPDVEIFGPAGGPFTTSDAAGRFRLEGARSGRWFLLAHKTGFQFHGRMVDSGATDPLELTLNRENALPERIMATLPEPISLEESRALARRLIGPYQKTATAKGDDAAKFRVLDIERWLNPAGLLEQVQNTRFDLGSSADFLRGRAALALAAADPEEAAAIAETIADPGRRAGALIDLVDALPAKEKPRKLALLDRAALQARSAGLSSNKLYQMGEAAERWLELGETAKAEALLAAGRKLAETLPPLKRRDAGSFSAHLARVEPGAALALAKDIAPNRRGSGSWATSRAGWRLHIPKKPSGCSARSRSRSGESGVRRGFASGWR